MPKAHYRCISCLYEWHCKPGPVVCPECGFDYVVWLNYDKVDWLGDDFGRAWNEPKTKPETPTLHKRKNVKV